MKAPKTLDVLVSPYSAVDDLNIAKALYDQVDEVPHQRAYEVFAGIHIPELTEVKSKFKKSKQFAKTSSS